MVDMEEVMEADFLEEEMAVEVPRHREHAHPTVPCASRTLTSAERHYYTFRHDKPVIEACDGV